MYYVAVLALASFLACDSVASPNTVSSFTLGMPVNSSENC